MKKVILFVSIILVCFSMAIVSCKKDDNNTTPTPTPTPTADITAPVITLLGNVNDVVVFKSSPSYIDMGATATDNIDGNVPVIVTGTVNMDSAGSYTLTYTAHDTAGNIATKTRTVVVNASPYLAGSYSVEDFTEPGHTSNGTYAETIQSSFSNNNKIIFAKFAFYSGATAYATISGNTITVPSQTILCGTPPQVNRNFTGTGTFTTTPPYTVTINYTEVTNGTTAQGQGVYTKL